MFLYEEVPIAFLDRQLKRLKNRDVLTMMVLRRNTLVEGERWKTEAGMRSCYPHLCSS